MIKIKIHEPPLVYQIKVKAKGEAFLKRHPHPTTKQFNKNNYWRFVHNDLYGLYKGICNYCGLWTPRRNNGRIDYTSVDHFIPKSVNPNLAYEWNNFRLCRSRLNSNKSDRVDILDPVTVENDWFEIDFSTFMVGPADDMDDGLIERVDRTVNALGLNEESYIEERLEIIKRYTLEQIEFSVIEEKYPFIAKELLRVDFDRNYKATYRNVFE